MGKPVERRKKKKGRPSLLDLQKRSLRLQKQQQQKNPNPNPNPSPSPSPSPNPYLRFPNHSSGRRPTHRNPNPDAAEAEEEDDDDEEEESSGKRREKKLKLVLRLPNRTNSPRDGSDSAPSASESEASRKKRKIEAVGSGEREKTGRQKSDSKATEPHEGEPSDSGPTTPLPDKKLLVFILDRLQKKDTYGVFSEPVDPNDLPDYHDIIDHPMDFGTVRKKLSSGAYENLEQFEKDVFLISSNAMRYNSPGTIYYRQARSIQELTKKNIENLRQESDDNEPEPEPKIVRRGRPPSKNTIKRTVGRLPAKLTGSDFSSDATLANARDGSQWSNSAHDLLRKVSTSDKPSTVNVLTRASHGFRSTETYIWNNGEHRSEINEEYSGSAPRGVPMRNGKKLSVIDENRRNTYRQPQPSTCLWEAPVLTTFDGEQKMLVPVGVHMEHAYARSLARFAANLGPVSWEIAAKRIGGALPPGTKFGPGWVGDGEAPLQSQQPLLSTSQPTLQSKILPCTTVLSRSEKLSERQELPPSSNSAVEEGHISTAPPPSASAAAAPTPNRPSDPLDGAGAGRGLNYESRYNLLSGGGMRPHAPSQLHQKPAMQPSMNGFNTAFGFNLPSQVGMMGRMAKPHASVGTDAMLVTHARALDMVSRSDNYSFIHKAPVSQSGAEKAKSVGHPSTINSCSPLPSSGHDPQGQWRSLSLNPKPGSVPPDLNVGFQSPGSQVPSMLSDPQPDLALQL